MAKVVGFRLQGLPLQLRSNRFQLLSFIFLTPDTRNLVLGVWDDLGWLARFLKVSSLTSGKSFYS